MSSTPPSRRGRPAHFRGGVCGIFERRSNCDECGRSGFSTRSRRGHLHLVTRDEEGLNRRSKWHCCNTSRNHCCFDCSIRLYQTNWSCPYCDADYKRSFIHLYGEAGGNGWGGFAPQDPSIHGPLWRTTE